MYYIEFFSASFVLVHTLKNDLYEYKQNRAHYGDLFRLSVFSIMYYLLKKTVCNIDNTALYVNVIMILFVTLTLQSGGISHYSCL